MERTVLTLLSTNYAGSHFASLMLGSHSRALYLGEILQVARPPKQGQTGDVCVRCGGRDSCAVLGGIAPEEAQRVYEIVFSRAGDSADVLVDNSKRVAWARRFVEHPPYRMKYLHLVRDPRALVRRWWVEYDTPQARRKQRLRWMRRSPASALSLLMASDFEVYRHRWVVRNRKIRQFIDRNGLDALTCTYHDLARHPEREVKRIVEWLGLEFEPPQLDYWDFNHHGTKKRSYEWVERSKQRYFDDRWKHDLPTGELERLRSHADTLRFVDSLGLVMHDDGLSRREVVPESSLRAASGAALRVRRDAPTQ